MLLIIAVTVSAGRWQLARADEKRALVARVELGRTLPPLVLLPALPAADMTEWRHARARGKWLPDFTVLVENRNHQGQPGFWVVSPLQFDPPTASGGSAGASSSASPGSGEVVAVLRGWTPRALGAMPGVAPVVVRSPSGVQDIQGELIAQVPRLLELSSLSGAAPASLASRFGAADGPPRLQNFDVATYAAATGLKVLPMVLQQTGEADDGLIRDWAPPPNNIDTHLGYAMQWFSFAAIAVIALGVLLVRRFRSPRR
ncbi:SURF1 family protein [Pigmentiphaga aceris]|uniref:SURF1-like protein n=1 Tax=Pigmentiphaga aceris TaxID=1940612 RepID=A0A5C0B3B0_9BURK|nr:SURF1 family protein [Pigmentiphaga aceris]